MIYIFSSLKVGQFSESQILVCLYSLARTYFIKNC